MRNRFVPLGGIGLAALLCATPLAAQPTPAIDPATIAMPELAFEPEPEDVRNYDKYFFFQRDETDFATAYADLRECDDYSHGFTYYAGGDAYAHMLVPGVLPSVVGGIIGSQLSDAIYGSAERRRMRRVNMRNCMGFKGYRIYGLRKSLWSEFNFEEGNRRLPEPERQRFLQVQARVASGPRPAVGEITQ